MVRRYGMRLACVLVLIAGCGSSLANVQTLIDQCRVQRVDYTRNGTFVVEPLPGTHRASDGVLEANERRIEYDGDPAELETALARAEAKCGQVTRLHE